ncbi:MULTISPECIES: LysR family transcriptional regulator [unclassified Pseudomonas]|uniref:LysR family transcriptional regulator n=1 Tax=unclassified Pseudomonas TaxID=196821 RepID=UPI0009D06341|nr:MULTISPECIES: LysR family transcriptional regulator [unclassified Pseudomonas]OOV89737.1 LysR family transcriptional regulator [Pseudomonas sp. MF4836]
MDLSKLTPSLEFQDQRLKYLFLSYQLGSMRAAADQLGIAPSSVSRQINLLQTELSIDLIEAGTHRIRLTEAGLVTVDYYRARASQHEALLNRLDDLRGQHLGKTVVAVGEGLFGAQLIGKLQSFFKSYPGLRTEILIAPTLEVQHMVMEDQAQIGVLFAPHPNPALRRQFGIKQPLRAIVHPDHPLARQPSITLEQLASTQLVLPNHGYRVRELVTLSCKGKPFEIEPAITANSLQVIIDFVKANMASTLLAEVMILPELKAGTLVALEVECPEMNSTELQIIRRQSRKLPPVTQELIRHLARSISKLSNAG